MLTRTTAFGLYDGNTVALLETARPRASRTPGAARRARLVTTLRARAIVFATGATERPLVFINNDRPGVMLAGAARSYLNRHAVLLGRHGRGGHQQRWRLGGSLRPWQPPVPP